MTAKEMRFFKKGQDSIKTGGKASKTRKNGIFEA